MDETGEPDVSAMTPETVTAALDRIPGALERARLGSQQAARGETITLDELVDSD